MAKARAPCSFPARHAILAAVTIGAFVRATVMSRRQAPRSVTERGFESNRGRGRNRNQRLCPSNSFSTTTPKSKRSSATAPTKPRLIARKESGVIEVDSTTTLRGVPPAAWEYRLGTYSAIEWVLERHKERAPKDPTLRDKFNTYRFADYKEPVIDLLGRVCAVSVQTMAIIRQMPA